MNIQVKRLDLALFCVLSHDGMLFAVFVYIDKMKPL